MIARSCSCQATFPSPPFRGEREGPSARRWEGEVGLIGKRSGIPHFTPTLSAPHGTKAGGEGDVDFFR
jgi:hypothetical protein